MAAALATQNEQLVSPWLEKPLQSNPTVNVLLTTFAGLGLPRTLSLPINASTTVHGLLKTIYSRLPEVHHTLIITTTSNKQLLHSNNEPISTLLSSASDTLLPLRLSARLCGGKGGFGSQLRAAGGRMSSRKNRSQNQNPNGSNRNLDGRRLRTVAVVKLLAEHIAKQDDEEKKQKEGRKKKLQGDMDRADTQMEQIKSGKLGVGQGRLDAEYVESKELAEEKTREAVINVMKQSMIGIERTGSESSMEEEGDESSSDGDEMEGTSSGSSEDAKPEMLQNSGLSFHGWDEDESSEDEADETEEPKAHEGKGKAKLS